MTKFQSTDDLFAHFKREVDLIVLQGMLKEGASPTSIMYSPLNCDSWISIEKAAISQIDYLAKVPCTKRGEASHSHPFVRLHVDTNAVPDPSALRVISILVSNRQGLDILRMVKGRSSARPLSACGEGATGWSACGGTAWCDGQQVQAADNERVFWNSDGCWLEACDECS